jgi:hypothetical protein
VGLSDAEIEARLAVLRRQRDALDREIADLVLYLELGRRLRGEAGGGADGRDGGVIRSEPDPAPPPQQRDTSPTAPAAPPREPPEPDELWASPGPDAPGRRPAGPPAEGRRPGDAIPPAIPFTEDAAGARRYGRALVAAACAALAEAGRPLHAAELLEILRDQGFTVPGRDPVAALNTRLWKRSGPNGPLRRVAEATYALAAPA